MGVPKSTLPVGKGHQGKSSGTEAKLIWAIVFSHDNWGRLLWDAMGPGNGPSSSRLRSLEYCLPGCRGWWAYWVEIDWFWRVEIYRDLQKIIQTEFNLDNEKVEKWDKRQETIYHVSLPKTLTAEVSKCNHFQVSNAQNSIRISLLPKNPNMIRTGLGPYFLSRHVPGLNCKHAYSEGSIRIY